MEQRNLDAHGASPCYASLWPWTGDTGVLGKHKSSPELQRGDQSSLACFKNWIVGLNGASATSEVCWLVIVIVASLAKPVLVLCRNSAVINAVAWKP